MPTDDATNTTVSFRLPPSVHDELVRVAEASSTTKHQLARTLLVRALEANGKADEWVDVSAGFDQAFQELQSSIADLRLAFGRGIGAILQDVSPTRDREEIRRWVFDRIVTPTPKPDADQGGD